MAIQPQVTTSTQRRPPGPPARFGGFGFLNEYRRDSLNTIFNLYRQYGELVFFRLGPLKAYLVSHPDHLHQVLVSDADSYYKLGRTKEIMGRFLGNGILLSDGDFWLRQRRLVQPAFHHRRIESYAQQMVEITQRYLADLKPGEPRDIALDMMRVTLAIVAKSLFNVDTSEMWQDINEALDFIQVATIQESYDFWPAWLPHARERRRRYNAHAETLYNIARKIIAERRQTKDDNGDLLSMLLLAVDEQGAGMSDQQALDETMTILLAGHDTTALLLAWMWHLLATNPQAEARLHEELDRVLGGRPPTLADLPNLPYLEMCVKETLRLYPSAWAFTRESIRDTQIGGYPVKKGSVIVVSPYALHRNPTVFESPEAYRPERFKDEKAWPRLAYLPFSAGPRVCIGNTFALMEARLVAATIAQRVRLVGQAGFAPTLHPMITLRMKGPLPMHIESRRAASQHTPD
jgi:cytochrome P450